MKRKMKILATSLLLAFAPLAGAQVGSNIDTQVSVLDRVDANRGQALVAEKIAGNFASLAGSEENALALVNALRTGETVQLTYAPTGTETAPTISTIDPPTGHMGWGNVKISLALAQDQLARLGITDPTSEQLQAALNGGDVIVANADGTTTTTTLRGVLQMRADGMGWGNIAKAGGTKLGPVVSQLKMANTKVAALPPGTSVKSRGITTATGTPASGKSKGLTTAGGVASTNASRGITTAQGAVTASHGSGHGRGLVTAGGGNPANTAAHGGGRSSGAGAGLVTGAGGGASGMTTAHGNAGGNGKGQGGGKGNGRGGG